MCASAPIRWGFSLVCLTSCITFDVIEGRTCAVTEDCLAGELCSGRVCLTPQCLNNDECDAGDACIDNRCATLASTGCAGDGDCKIGEVCVDAACKVPFTVTAVSGTSVNLDLNGKARVRDRLRVSGEGVMQVSTAQLIAGNGTSTDLSIAAVGADLELLLPAGVAANVRSASTQTFTLRLEHPLAGTLTVALTLHRGEGGPKGPTGSTGPTGANDTPTPGQPVRCGNDGLLLQRTIAGTELSCMSGRNDVQVSLLGATLTPPLLDIARSDPATMVVTAPSGSTAVRLENTEASGATLRVQGLSDFTGVTGITGISGVTSLPGNMKLPIYTKTAVCSDGDAASAVCGCGASTCRTVTLGCDDLNDQMLFGTCYVSGGNLFADCPTRDLPADWCLEPGQTAVGLRCRADSTPASGVTMRGSVTCLKVRP